MEQLNPVGKIRIKAASEIRTCPIGIGFEKLDRNVFSPDKAYDKVAGVGVKWARIQSGWARCEPWIVLYYADVLWCLRCSHLLRT